MNNVYMDGFEVQLSDELCRMAEQGRVWVTSAGEVRFDNFRWAVRYRGVWMTPEERRELYTDEDRRTVRAIMIIGMSIALLVIATPPWPWPFA